MTKTEERASEVALRLLKLVGEIAEEKLNQGWTGQEFVLGFAAAFKQICEDLEQEPAEMIEAVGAVNVKHG